MSRPPLLGLLAGSLLFSVVAAHAVQTITVNSDADSGGICPGATCTLRQAIATALPEYTIDFAPGITTITLTSAELSVNKNLTIDGPGAKLLTVQRSSADGTPPFRIFNITAGDVTISGLTIANGKTVAASEHGGAIHNSTGTLNLTGCTISGNETYIDQYGSVSRGGGIFNPDGGTVNITLSTISANRADENGGGIYNSSGGTVTITNSTISGNHAQSAEEFNKGGGIYNSSGGTVTITNSTISGNVASSGRSPGSAEASGIYNDAGTLTITSCTIAGNWGSGIANYGTVYARNSIIAKNHIDGTAYPPDFYGTLTSRGYNLIGDTHAYHTTITGDTTGNKLNVDPKLGPLQDNGGPTFTQALLFGSPAIDAGDSSGSNTDQRGFTRPVDASDIPNATGGDGSDIGAFEEQSPMSATPTPTPTATATATPTATPTSTPISTPTATPTSTPAKALNISSRSRVQTGENVMIGGFIVTGNTSKKVIVRALGPSLKPALTDVLADPTLELHGPNGSLIASNDNWKDNPSQALLIQASGLPPKNDLESAIVATLHPAGYTAIVGGKSGGTGLGLVEVYDLDDAADSALANISTRARVGIGDDVLIGGFILGGENGNCAIVVRAIGPSLSALGIADPLADPTLELRDGNGQLLAFDDNWEDNPANASRIKAAGLQPRDKLEAAIAATLSPGTYTAIVAGRNKGTGVGLVEIYTLP